ncbi:MAG: glycosyltransferase [Elusimicrobiota bacterium]
MNFTLFHIDGERGFRGGERQLLYLACRMRELGHRNVVVCRRDGALDREAERRGLERLHLPFLFEWDPVSAWLLRRRALAAPSPLLHAHTAHAASIAWLAALGTPLPRVAHRRVDFRMSDGLSRRMKYDSAGAVVAVSEGVREVLVADGLDPARVRVVHDSLPVGPEEARAALADEPLAPPTPDERAALRASLSAEWGVPTDALWVVNAAALVPHKDHDTLLRAAAIVVKERPDARFIVLGEGPLRRALEALSSSLGLGASLRLVGFRRDAVRCLKACDLFVLSSWGEGMGSVLLEAMACGLPVAATSAGGIPEVVRDRATGLLAPPRNPRRLAEAILESFSDGEATARRAEAALASVRDFSIAASSERMSEVYREAAGARP